LIRRENLVKGQTLSKKGNYQIENFHFPEVKNSLELRQCGWKPPQAVFNQPLRAVGRGSVNETESLPSPLLELLRPPKNCPFTRRLRTCVFPSKPLLSSSLVP
jgi:hypothetical protein